METGVELPLQEHYEASSTDSLSLQPFIEFYKLISTLKTVAPSLEQTLADIKRTQLES